MAINSDGHDLNSRIFKYGVFWPVVTARGEPVFKLLSELEQSQWFPEERLREIQEEKLARVLAHSGKHVRFYRHRDGSTVDVERSPSRLLRQLPLITKADLIASNAALRSDGHRGPVTVKTTGGSTGQAPFDDRHKRTIFHAHGNEQVSVSFFEVDLNMYRRVTPPSSPPRARVPAPPKLKTPPAGYARHINGKRP